MTVNILCKSRIVLFSLTQLVLRFVCFSFQYSVSIEENALHSDLLQIRVIDLDEEYSANWMAVIFFISGNEGGWFDIEMNERTNVGILKVIKVWYNCPEYFVFSVSFKMLTIHKIEGVKE